AFGVAVVEEARPLPAAFGTDGDELAGVLMGAGAAGLGGASLVAEEEPTAPAVGAAAVETVEGVCDFSETRSPSALSTSRRSAVFFDAPSLRSPFGSSAARPLLSPFFGAGAAAASAAFPSAAGPTRTPPDWKHAARA